MKLEYESKFDPERRRSVRRTVWVLALLAGAIYGYFIVKTFLQQMGSAA